MTPLKNLLIVPTRSRPHKALEFYDEFVKHSDPNLTTLCFALDEDDADNYYLHLPGVLYEINPRMGMNGTLNHVATKYCDVYDFISFMGDDHRIRTVNWDREYIEAIWKLRYGIVYGNDLLQGENLPTQVMIDAEIVRVLGFMAPPALKHLYLDNFWKETGERLGTLRYLPNVIVEHMHYFAGKSPADALYEEVNSSAMYDHDRAVFENYKATEFDKDLAKLC
jgi:hypothetical protein